MFDTVTSVSSKHGVALARRSADPEHVRHLRAAVRHRYNLVGVVACVVMALPLGCGLLSLLILAAQLGSWLVLPRLAWFRKQVDAQRDLEARRTAIAVRAHTLGQLSDEHRLRFLRLEGLIDEIGHHVDCAGGDDAGDCYGLRWLLATYLSVAIAHRAARQALSVVPREVLSMEVAAIRNQQRRAIAVRRLARWDRTAAELDRLGEQLATIDSIVHLAHESSLAASTIDGASADAQQLIAEVSEGRGVLETLAMLPSRHEPIDPRVFLTREEGTIVQDDPCDALPKHPRAG